MTRPDDVAARLRQLERELEELVASLPAHSVPPAMLIRIEDLETEIDRLKKIVNAFSGEDDGG